VKHRAKKALAALTGGIAAFLVAVPPASADSIRDRQWHVKYLNVAEAHSQSQGEGVVVAVLDTGVNGNHPDLAGNVLPGLDVTGTAPNGSKDTDGHGTGMAGLVAAHGHGNGEGALGIAPRAKILPIKDSETTFGNPQAFIAGVNAAAKSGAKVICIASSGSNSAGLQNAITAALAADIVVVAGMGNRPDVFPGYPAAYDGVVAVGAIGQDGNLAGLTITGRPMVLSAPGMRIVSTDGVGGYRVADGTSDSTAIVAGAAALVRSKYPNLSAKEVIHRLTATATDKGAPGRDPEYGYGVLNLVGALTANVPPETSGAAPTTTPPTATASPTRTGGAALPDSDKGGSSTLPVVLLGVGVAVLAAGGLMVWLLVRRRQAPTAT